MLAAVETQATFRCLIAITRDRMAAIVPNHMKPVGPVRMVVQDMNEDFCVMHLIPDPNAGINGASAAGNSKCYDEHWAYERHIPKAGKTRRFGRTKCSVTTLENGTVELRTIEPLKPMQAKPRSPRSKAKGSANAVPQNGTEKVMKAVKQLMEMPDPNAPKIELGSLRSLVRSINTLKDELGSDLCLSIDPTTGRLKAIVEYG